MLYWWLLTLSHSWVSGNYVVHFSSGQGLQPETKTTGSQRPRPRPAVNLSVSGHRFQCQLPGVGDAHGDGGAYTALLRSAAFKGQCISGWTDDEQEFEVCLGHRFNLGPHVAWHQPPDTTTTDAGFEQRYVGPEMEATLECRCAKERKESEPEACGLGQHVWVSESGSSPWMAMVVGDHEAELSLRRIGRGEERGSFRVARQRLRSAEDGRSCTESRSVEKLKVKASKVEDSKFLLRLQAPSCCKMAPMEDIHATIMNLLAPLEGSCQYVQNGWWTYELCWPWHVRRMHYHTVAAPEAHIFRVLHTSEDSTQKTTISGATQAEVASVGGILGFFGARPNVELRRSLVGKRPAGFRGPSAWPQEVVLPFDSGDDCRIAANTWLISVTDFGATIPVLEVPGVGGPFNPATLDSAEGFLAASDGNEDGCDVFHERLDGKVLLVKRGNCFFQVKANNAEDAGAVAVIVYNDQRPPVESMEGVEELLPPRIPSLFVHTEKGVELLGHLGRRAQVMKVGHEHLQLSEPITGSVVFRCSEDFQREKMCQAGDTVDVKLWVKSSAKSKPPKPPPQSAGVSDQELHELAVLQAQVDSSSLRMLRGQVLAAEEGSLLIQWLGEQEQDIILGTVPGMNLESEPPARVPLSAAFRDGVRCTASREAWIEKLLEPYACTAEFVVHVASLCALPQLSPQKPREERGIHCQMERTV